MGEAEKRLVAALWSLQGVGYRAIEAILQSDDSARLLTTPPSMWAPHLRLRAPVIAALLKVSALESVFTAADAVARATAQTMVFPGDTQWPRLIVRGLVRFPMLYLRGPGETGRRKRCAMVGPRHPAPGTAVRVERLAREVAGHGVGVVSGAAEGVDAAAHRGAIAAQQESWAFLGCGIDVVRPRQRELCDGILGCGGSLWSPFPPGTRASKESFVRRNPLISAAADVVLVSHAQTKSGSLYTAEAALEQARPLFVLPGDPWNPAAAGSNLLLRRGARACLEATDILAELGIARTRTTRELPADVSNDAACVRSVLERYPAGLDGIIEVTGIEGARVRAALVELELEGIAMRGCDGKWERV